MARRKTLGRDYMGPDKEPPPAHPKRAGGRVPFKHSHGPRSKFGGKRGRKR
jgi:hypothetical protein